MGGLFSSSQPEIRPSQQQPRQSYNTIYSETPKQSYYQPEQRSVTRQSNYRGNLWEDHQSLRLAGAYRSERHPVRNIASPKSSYQPEQRYLPSQTNYTDTFWKDFDSLSLGGYTQRHTTRTIEPPVRALKNSSILNINCDPYFDSSRVVTFITLSEWDPEYQQIKRRISNKHNFIVDSIERIENPYLKKAYELKKQQKEKEYLYNLEERLLFHGTKHTNINDICTFNFNWRLCQAHKYGAGVSFSPNSTYASNYSDEYQYNKVMIVAKVLIGRSCLGNENIVLPDEGCDTSQKGQDAIVIVKYEDNEFYPAFKINYHLVNPNIGKGKKRANRRNNRQVFFS